MQTNGKTQRPDKCQRGRGSSSQKTNKREIKETASSKRKKGIANHSNRRAAYRYMKSCCRFFSESCPALFILQRHVTYTGARQGSRQSNQACGPAKQEKNGVVSIQEERVESIYRILQVRFLIFFPGRGPPPEGAALALLVRLLLPPRPDVC